MKFLTSPSATSAFAEQERSADTPPATRKAREKQLQTRDTKEIAEKNITKDAAKETAIAAVAETLGIEK